MTMDARKQRVLQAIVALYGLEGEPVGSSVLANYFDMAVSSATLRNEMAALTKLGLLEQPHTSAGRVPSAKGYRYYLDHLLTDDQPLDRVTRARVDAVFASLDHEPEKLAQGAAKALAAISGCTAAVSTPCAEDLCIAHYEVVQVGRSAAAVLAVTTAGYVRTRVARVRTGLSRENAAALAALLNRNLTFVAPVDLSPRLLAELCSQISPELVPVISAAAAILQDSTQPHVYLGGEQYLLDWPQLDGKVGSILSLLNDEEQAAALIAPPAEQGESILPHGIAGASRLAGQRAQFVQVTIIQRPQPGQLAAGLAAAQTAMLDCWWIFNIRTVASWIQDARLDGFWRVPLAQRFESNKALFSGRTQDGILAPHAHLIAIALQRVKKLPPCKALLNRFVHILSDGGAPSGLTVLLGQPFDVGLCYML